MADRATSFPGIFQQAKLFFDRRKIPPTEVGGVPGTQIFGGFIERNEKNPNLEDNAKRYETFSDILINTSIVAAGARFFLNLVSKGEWTVEPADESDQAKEIADFIQDSMGKMETSWPRMIRRVASFRLYGFSLQEWQAERDDDGKLRMKNIHPRPQHTIEKWDVNDDGDVVGIIQRSPQTGEELYINREKLIYALDDALSDSPEGVGLLRHLVEPNNRLIRLQQLEAFGYETDLRGVPVGRAPIAQLNEMVKNGDITKEVANAALAPLTSFIQKHIKNPQLGILLDSSPYISADESERPIAFPQWDLQLLSTEGDSSMEAVAQAIERLNREIARILGVEGLMLGGDGRGSMALSRDKTQSFGLIVDSTLTELEEVLNRDYIKTLMDLNGWPEELTPRLKTEQVQHRDVEQITKALRDLADAGSPLMPGDPAIDEIRDLLGLSRVPKEVVDAMLEAAMIGAQERTRLSAGGAKPGEQDKAPGPPTTATSGEVP